MDYSDFIGILALLIVNSTISFIEENNAGNAAQALMARLAPKAKVTLYCIFFPSISYHFALLCFQLASNTYMDIHGLGFARRKMERGRRSSFGSGRYY